MNNIIEKIYRGELCPAEQDDCKVCQLKRLYEEKKQQEKSFYCSLNEEQKKEYELMMEMHFMISGKELEQEFCNGFRMAFQLIGNALL